MNPMQVSLDHFIALSALIFGLGLLGLVLNRTHLIKTLLSIEIMLLGVNLAFIASGIPKSGPPHTDILLYNQGHSSRSKLVHPMNNNVSGSHLESAKK